MHHDISNQSAASFHNTPLSQHLSWLLLLTGCLITLAVPLAGSPPLPPPLFGRPGVILTFDPQLQQLERDIAAGRSHTFTIQMRQANIDAEIAAQMSRLGDSSVVRNGILHANDGTITAAGILDIGIAAVPVSFDLAVIPSTCTPRVEIRRFDVGDASTPGWLEDRAQAFVRKQIDAGLRRGLGFCVKQAEFREGEAMLSGWIEGGQS